jgi:DNA-binding MarR family transcriptional regulator
MLVRLLELFVARSETRLVHEFMARLDQSGDSSPLAAMYELGLSMPQIVALDKVHREGPTPISAIAQRLQMSMSASSTLIQVLVERELVTRTEDPEDRRQRLVAMTPKGSAAFERLIQDGTVALGRVVTSLPADIRHDLMAVVARVVTHLRKPK